MTEQELTNLFARLGAREPAGCAHSQITDGFPQLARFLFLRQAWKHVLPERDTTWIQRQMNTNANGPGGAIVPALRRVLEQGVAENDLTTIARVIIPPLLQGDVLLLQ